MKSFKYSWAQAKPREVDLPVKMTTRERDQYTNEEEEDNGYNASSGYALKTQETHQKHKKNIKKARLKIINIDMQKGDPSCNNNTKHKPGTSNLLGTTTSPNTAQ